MFNLGQVGHSPELHVGSSVGLSMRPFKFRWDLLILHAIWAGFAFRLALTKVLCYDRVSKS